MKGKWIILAAIGAAFSFSFALQTTPVQQASRPMSKKEELEREGFRFPKQTQPTQRDMQLLRGATVQNMPYMLSATSMAVPLHKPSNHYDRAITTLVNERIGSFSRTPMLNYEFVALLGVHGDFTTVVYRTANSYSDDLYPMYYHIATIDASGKLISTASIASLNSPLIVRTATVNCEGLITITALKQTWEKDPLTAGYKDNKIVSSEVTSVTSRKIDADGQIDFDLKKDKPTKLTEKVNL